MADELHQKLNQAVCHFSKNLISRFPNLSNAGLPPKPKPYLAYE
jgi:hypothetical protein